MSDFGNCAYSYDSAKGRRIFVPSKEGRAIGLKLKSLVENLYTPEDFFYHLGEDGGHVTALHRHRPHKYFAKIDLQRFFYSVGRNRVKGALKALGVRSAEHYARWSCVKNPCEGPSYALPYGFVQSPLIATLVLSQSRVGNVLRDMADELTVSVYVDDIALSSNNRRRIERAYNRLRKAIIKSNLAINDDKSIPPSLTLKVFNCHLSRRDTVVTEERRNDFYAFERSDLSVAAFEDYCDAVATGNG